MKNGIYRGLSFQEYRALEAINVSGLKLFKKSPAHFFANLIGANERTQTPAMKLGEAIHCACLERGEFEKRYVQEPLDAPRRPTSAQINAKKPSDDSLAQIAFWREFDEFAAGKIILSQEHYARVLKVAQTFWEHPASGEFLSDCLTEVTLVWTDKETGLKCKARLDAAVEGSGLFDIKSTLDASPEEFKRQFFKLDYHMQAAWYVDGWREITGETLPFIFIAQEKENEPFESAWYLPEDNVMELGHEVNSVYLSKYAECVKSGSWPGYPKEILSIELPAWMQKPKSKTEEY